MDQLNMEMRKLEKEMGDDEGKRDGRSEKNKEEIGMGVIGGQGVLQKDAAVKKIHNIMKEVTGFVALGANQYV